MSIAYGTFLAKMLLWPLLNQKVTQMTIKASASAKSFPIVCVGGSAGGLDAYIRLLDNLPPDLGVAIVVVNHLRSVPTRLHEILPLHTTMPVSSSLNVCK